MTKRELTPCNNYCRYEEIDGVQTCISCFRTYDDLENWMRMSDHEKREIIKECKKRKREYKKR